jgi:hypothetical protein
VLALSSSAALGQEQASGPLPRHVIMNGYQMPAFDKLLPKGRNAITFRNPSHFEMIVQVRTGGRAAQFVLKGKTNQRLYLPGGEYTIFYRFLSERTIRKGRSFLARGGEFFEDDGSPMEHERVMTGPPPKAEQDTRKNR